MYKFENEEGTAVKNLETGQGNIHQGVWLWRQYQKWVDAGGTTEPWKTQAELDMENEELAAQEAREARDQDLEVEREAAGMKTLSVEQARNYIDNQFSGITTLEELVAANVKVWKKAMPFILPKG